LAIELVDVSKFYLQKYSALEIFLNALLGVKTCKSDKFYALKNINLAIKPGESVGVVGLNGSGKSTLLQVIAGTMKASSGEISVSGKVAAILELGSGFNPNFSGIENVFLNASLHGFSRFKTEKILDEIIDFSGIGKHASLPVSTYSSGMIVRLAYAIVSKLDPEILLVDEALAVGDFLFQQKCIKSMRNLQQNGTSILFVSHSLELISEFCTKILILNKGSQIFFGSTKEGIHKYQELILEQKEIESCSTPSSLKNTFKINSLVSLDDCRILYKGAESLILNNSSSEMQIVISLTPRIEFEDLHCGFNIVDEYGRVSFGTTTYALKHSCGNVNKKQTVIFTFELEQKLKAGKYSITVGVANKGYGFPDSFFRNSIAFFENAIMFEVFHSNKIGKWSGSTYVATKVNSMK
jgi:lipopolysaccharide transport system ATP-binding protein